MKKNGAKKRRGSGLRDVMPAVLGMGMAGPIAAYGAFYILVHTGPWCVPLFLSYIALLMVPSAYFLSHREKQNLHFQMGHEMFYRENPAALKGALKKARRRGISAEKQALIEQYAALPLKRTSRESASAERERRRSLCFYYVSGALLLALAAFLFFRAAELGRAIRLAQKSAADYTPLLLYAEAAAVLAAALFLFFKKKAAAPRAAALLIMLFASWSLYISFTVNRVLSLSDVLINLALCAVYSLIAFPLPAAAKDVRTQEEILKGEKELQLALFELDIITEEDLKVRLT